MLKILREVERGAVFRLGKFHRVAGPGLVLLIPPIDRMLIVDLDHTIPEWRGVTPEELKSMVEFLVLHYPEIPKGLRIKDVRDAMQKARRQ